MHKFIAIWKRVRCVFSMNNETHENKWECRMWKMNSQQNNVIQINENEIRQQRNAIDRVHTACEYMCGVCDCANAIWFSFFLFQWAMYRSVAHCTMDIFWICIRSHNKTVHSGWKPNYCIAVWVYTQFNMLCE